MDRCRSSGEQFTLAVVGRNEAGTLPGVIELARQAAAPGDRLWFVDSASTDDSASVARRMGVEVITAPAGKGRAIATALERCGEGYICFVDGDLFGWDVNIFAALRSTAVRTRAHMVVGGYRSNRRRSISPALYWPLVDALVPDLAVPRYPRPLSGLRAIDAALAIGPIPPGYGVETYLNLTFAAAGRKISLVDLGRIRGPLRGYANVVEVGSAVVAAILDFAVSDGRLDRELRPEWERWAGDLLELIATQPPPGAPDGDYLERLTAAASRPLPPTGPLPPTRPQVLDSRRA